jgi:hypothetical protein
MGAESTSGGRPGVDDGMAEAIPVDPPRLPEVPQQRARGVVEAKVARELVRMAKMLIEKIPTRG